MSREEVLDKLADLRRREGDSMAKMHAAAELGRFERAGLTVLPCTIHEFLRRAGLLVLDPQDPEDHLRVARVYRGGTWWDDPEWPQQGYEEIKQMYVEEAARALQELRDGDRDV